MRLDHMSSVRVQVLTVDSLQDSQTSLQSLDVELQHVQRIVKIPGRGSVRDDRGGIVRIYVIPCLSPIV